MLNSMQYNDSRVLASELYLIEHWKHHTGPPSQRRKNIFLNFVALGMHGRWRWHARAETISLSEFTPAERKMIDSRDERTRIIADHLRDVERRVVVTAQTGPIEDEDVEFRTCESGYEMYVCRYGGENPLEVLPELAWSVTTFDDPYDAEELRVESRDQSLWVSGVFWLEWKIVWVDEFGATIREKECDPLDRDGMREACLICDEANRPFESTWWTEATKVGKYAEDGWW